MYREMITVNNKKELIELIKQRIKDQGPKCDLNDIDVSKVTDMSHLFYLSIFDGDISKWNVGSVVDMRDMFEDSPLEFREPSWCRDDD